MFIGNVIKVNELLHLILFFTCNAINGRRKIGDRRLVNKIEAPFS